MSVLWVACSQSVVHRRRQSIDSGQQQQAPKRSRSTNRLALHEQLDDRHEESSSEDRTDANQDKNEEENSALLEPDDGKDGDSVHEDDSDYKEDDCSSDDSEADSPKRFVFGHSVPCFVSV